MPGEYSKQYYLLNSLKSKYSDLDLPELTLKRPHHNELPPIIPLKPIIPPTPTDNNNSTSQPNQHNDYVQEGIDKSRNANTAVGLFTKAGSKLDKGTTVLGGILSAADLVKMGFDKGTDQMNFDDGIRMADDITGIASAAANMAVPGAGTALTIAEKAGTGLAKIIKAEIDDKPKNPGEFWNTATNAAGVGWVNKDLKDLYKEDIKPKVEKVVETIHKVSDWGDMSKWKERAKQKKAERKEEKKQKREEWKKTSAKEKARIFFFG
jgi:hypothetical protein